MNDFARRARPYLVAIGAVLLGVALRVVLPLPEGRLPFVTLFPAIAAAAWYGGLWPGAFSVVAAYIAADLCFLSPAGKFNLLLPGTPMFAESLVFVCMAGLIVAMGHSLHRANERVRFEADLAAQRGETLRITLASIGDGVIATDSAGNVSFMNAVAEEMTGWPQSEAKGQPLTKVFPIVNEQTRQIVENPCDKVLRTGRVVGLANHTVLISRSGGERPIDDSAAPILDQSGRVQGVVLVFSDATKKRLNAASQQNLASIVEHSDDAVISKNRQGVITSWNAAAERLYGFTAEEIIGQHISVIVPADHQEELDEIMRRLWRGERIEHWDTVRQRKDGSRVDVSLRISPIKDARGEVIGASKVARDVTERKRVERALEFLAETSVSLAALVDRESALQQAAETMVPFFADYCVVYLAGPDGALTAPACAHRDSEKGRLLRELLRMYSVDSLSTSVTAQAWRTGEVQFVPEMPALQLEGLGQTEEHRKILREIGPRSVISVPLRIRERQVGVISFVKMEGRYVENDMRLAEDLARRVAIALDNSQLLASVREADRQKDEFLAMLAHELRNPLAAISYAVEAVRLPHSHADGEMLDLIERQVQNLSRLIDDLLDISRISRDKIQLRKETIDAAVVARRAAATVQPMIQEKQHELHVDMPAGAMPIRVDPTRAEQIVANLLTNAAKYTPEGGEITLRAYPEKGEAVIMVADTGIGISPETLPFVFELFAQADQTLDRSQGGLGIGLTVVRKLAEMHGGSVTASSQGVGKGSEFTVRLPLCEAVEPEAAGALDNGQAAAARLRVLVVDDNHDTARAEALLLKRHGHEVEVAHDGVSALESAKRFRPHAILLDIGLPLLNGYEVASRLRADGFTKEPLIAVSGYGQMEDRDRSRRAGFDHHLVKPIELNALLAILREVRPEETAAAQ